MKSTAGLDDHLQYRDDRCFLGQTSVDQFLMAQEWHFKISSHTLGIDSSTDHV